MTESSVSDPFVEPAQQQRAAMMGMYIFLGSETMLFGGLFAVVMVLRILHPVEIVHASKELHYFLGAVNTAILLTSSFAVAVAVEAARAGRTRASARWLAAAAALGVAFVLVKAYEYSAEYAEGLLPVPGVAPRFADPSQHLFMNLYLIGTALHAVHLLVGVTALMALSCTAWMRRIALPSRSIVVVNCGLYWHLVDIVWIFLYPVFYLVR